MHLELKNQGETTANEVIVRSIPSIGLIYKEYSASIDGEIVTTSENPFASGPAKIGLNIGTVKPGASLIVEYQVTVSAAQDISEQDFASTFSTREAVIPIKANAAEPMSLSTLVAQIRTQESVIFAEQLSFVDLPPGALSAKKPVDGLVRAFGFDVSYTKQDATIKILEGSQLAGEAMISAEAAHSLAVGIGDTVSLALPDGSQLEARISGIVDFTQARSLFSSRQGANLEAFIYVPNALVLDSVFFADRIVPSFERAATSRGERIKSLPIREVDIGVNRALLDAEPSVALGQTQSLAESISSVAGGQGFLLDNISNTLAVARDDAKVAKRMFVVLGIPGAMLAAMLASYAGIVLAGAQRREQATLRIRGASRKHLLSMLLMRVSCITLSGAGIGIPLGYTTAAAVLGYNTLMRTTLASLVTSAVLGTSAGLLATGSALYFTGRRSIEREINEEKARLWAQPPAWRRFYLDILGIVAVIVTTMVISANSGFEGTPGSVYVGRAVQLPLGLLFLLIAMWISATFLGGRIVAWILAHPRMNSSLDLKRPFFLLYRMSLKQRSWVLVDAAVILGLIVALSTSLAIFTTSYDAAKAADARYTVGSDIRVTPKPASGYRSGDANKFMIKGIGSVAPVVYGVHNVVLRSKRTEEVANLAALNPEAYLRVAPLDTTHFSNGSAEKSLNILTDQPDSILLSTHMASFLQAKEGDTIRVLLARATSEQIEIEMKMVGSFERLPGFPESADALMNINRHEEMVASTSPAFFLAQTHEPGDAALAQTATALRNGPGSNGKVQIDTRLTALAKDQSSLAALNIAGLLQLDSGYSLAMGAMTVAIFVFGLLLQRRREYVTLRAQGMQSTAIRILILAEAGTAAFTGCSIGVSVGLIMAFYLINILRPLFVLDPVYHVPLGSLSTILGLVLSTTGVTSVAASSLVNRLRVTELLRDE